MTDKHTLVERLNAQIPYVGKSAVVFLCHEAATHITALEAEKAELVEALSGVLHEALWMLEKVEVNPNAKRAIKARFHAARATLAKHHEGEGK